jgi:superoxide dismutase
MMKPQGHSDPRAPIAEVIDKAFGSCKDFQSNSMMPAPSNSAAAGWGE